MSPKNKKSLLIATFLRLGIVASSPDRRLRPESTAKWLYCGSFPLCGSEGESPIAKKLQKARYFCFCDWLIVAMGRIPPRMNRIRTEIRAYTCRATKKPPEGGFVLKYMAGPAGFPRSASALPLGASACRQIPKNVPQARFLYGISPHRFESFASGKATKNRPKAVSFSNIWLGQQDSNLHNWYQKPGSCHWTMAQRMP